MKVSQILILILLSLGVNLAVAQFQQAPGFMDAAYYYLNGRQLALGEGFSEPILWNYLDNPAGLPHPSHSYWMPLASIVAAVGMKVGGIDSFQMARLGFFVAASLVPWLTARLSYQLTGKRSWAFGAGLLAIFSGFYLPYTTITDTFTLYMLTGGLIFLIMPRTFSRSRLATLLLGILVGILHLTRVDGIVWLPAIGLFFIIEKGTSHKKWERLTLFVLGYVLLMGPWFVRNLLIFGSPFGAGGSKTLWLTNYDQIFSYPAEVLTFSNWWASGIRQILEARLWAAGINLQRMLGEQGGILLIPFMVLGLWRLRQKTNVRVAAIAWLLTVVLMTVIFPYAGARGGLFHACAVFQPLFWAVVPVGLNVFVTWGERKRGWQARQASQVFGVAGVLMMVLLSLGILAQKVIGPDYDHPIWEESTNHYRAIEKELQDMGVGIDEIVMVKDPPDYAAANNRPAIVIPDGDFETLMAVASRYGARYILLEEDHSNGLDDLYLSPESVWPGIEYVDKVDETLLFEIQ